MFAILQVAGCEAGLGASEIRDTRSLSQTVKGLWNRTLAMAIAAATALGTLDIVLLAWRSLFTPSHQLRLDRLHNATLQ
jgi:hypothetical protein